MKLREAFALLDGRWSLCWVVGLLCWGCTSAPSPLLYPPSTCTQSQDCPAHQSCVENLCLRIQMAPGLDGPRGEPTGSEPQAEPIPDASTEMPPTDPGAACVSGQLRACYNGGLSTRDVGQCKDGKQTCTDGRWGPCLDQVLPRQEVCNGKDDDCDGTIDQGLNCTCRKGDSQRCGTDVGQCKAGTQKCVDGTWGPCAGEVEPSAELCDGRDNDCDGNIDQDLKRTCYTGAAGTENKGECKGGNQSCVAGKWGVCLGQVTPSKEICDGKDNDCNGQIDEEFPEKARPCVAGTTGNPDCDDGKYVCEMGGKLRCQAKLSIGIERCRDNKDNDCDGQTDEICGSPSPYGSFDHRGTKQSGSTDLSSRKLSGAGLYDLRANNAAHGCNRDLLFATPLGRALIPVAPHCAGARHLLAFGAPRSSVRADSSFMAGIPPFSIGNRYVRVFGGQCDPNSKNCKLYPTANQGFGKGDITRLGAGRYRIHKDLCGKGQPIMAALFTASPTLKGFATAYPNGSSECIVYTFDLSGKPRDLDFQIWLPNPQTTAWAVINGNSVVDKNDFGDQQARWSSKQLKDATFGDYTELKFPAWANSSAVLITPRTGYALAPSVHQPSTLSGGVHVYLFRPPKSTKATNAPYTAIFLQ